MSYRGVSVDQDTKFTNAERKLMKDMKFPSEYSQKVDMQKVNLNVMKPWIAQRVIDLLNFEDDVVIDFAISMLESERMPDPRRLHINMTGFLEGKTTVFMRDLWKLLLSAQDNVGGVPPAFIEAKKAEIRSKQSEEAAIADTLRRAQAREAAQEREANAIRERERAQREASGRGRGRGRGDARGRGRGSRGRGHPEDYHPRADSEFRPRPMFREREHSPRRGRSISPPRRDYTPEPRGSPRRRRRYSPSPDYRYDDYRGRSRDRDSYGRYERPPSRSPLRRIRRSPSVDMYGRIKPEGQRRRHEDDYYYDERRDYRSREYSPDRYSSARSRYRDESADRSRRNVRRREEEYRAISPEPRGGYDRSPFVSDRSRSPTPEEIASRRSNAHKQGSVPRAPWTNA